MYLVISKLDNTGHYIIYTVYDFKPPWTLSIMFMSMANAKSIHQYIVVMIRATAMSGMSSQNSDYL